MSGLIRDASLIELGTPADLSASGLAPEGRIVTFNIGRNINYTNVCRVRCKFCAFYRVPGHEEGYVLTDDADPGEVPRAGRAGRSREILIQGGLNPKLKIDYYEHLFRRHQAAYPIIDIHGLSSAEINYVAHISSSRWRRRSADCETPG